MGEFSYAAQTWAHAQRVITRRQWGEQGCNPRFVVTQALHDELYCQRGGAENRIKEAQVGLFATRTICHVLRSNQLRMLLPALGYVLIERLRALGLQGTALASAQVDALRIRLLKGGRSAHVTQKGPATEAGVGVVTPPNTTQFNPQVSE